MLEGGDARLVFEELAGGALVEAGEAAFEGLVGVEDVAEGVEFGPERIELLGGGGGEDGEPGEGVVAGDEAGLQGGVLLMEGGDFGLAGQELAFEIGLAGGLAGDDGGEFFALLAGDFGLGDGESGAFGEQGEIGVPLG